MYSPDLDQETRMNLMFDFTIRIGYGKQVCQFLWKDELENLRKVNTQCNEIIPIYVERWGSKWNSYDLCKKMILYCDEIRRCSKQLVCGECDDCDYIPRCDRCFVKLGIHSISRGLCISCSKDEDEENERAYFRRVRGHWRHVHGR